MSDRLSELGSARIMHAQEHPENRVSLENFYFPVERVLENWIKDAQSILEQGPLTFTSFDRSIIDCLYVELNESFIKARPEVFRSIFGHGKFKKRVVWLETEALLVYFVDLLFKKKIVHEADKGKMHVMTSDCFIRKDGQGFNAKQLPKTKGNISKSGKPRDTELLDDIFEESVPNLS